jgi:hypothetical protein
LFSSLFEQLQITGHAGARVEHNDNRNRLDFVDEEVQRLRLIVVEDLKIFLREVGHEPLTRVCDGGVKGYRPGAGSKRRLLREGRKTSAKQHGCRQETTYYLHGRTIVYESA